MGADKRRSDRIMLTIPLRLKGKDEHGSTFDVEGRTLILNRHGARIHTKRRLLSGEKIRVASSLTHRTAAFRVVGPVAPFTDQGGEFGVEYEESKDNIWGIQFPPPEVADSDHPKAVLECHRCHHAALQSLTLVEVEVLETAGLLTRACDDCGEPTLWGYAEKQLTMGTPDEQKLTQEVQAEADAAARAANRRRHARVALQLPIRVRNYFGATEISKTENVSKGGFCFISDSDYQVGEGVLVVCPYDSQNQAIEILARIVRHLAIEGSSRSVYGVRYGTKAT